ncbi:hypothetical protein ABT354_10690 [Streptomyces sp. NPDC000594]|uniref:hypothetical protein n=1 Tax=Streptomyces sp. NPDC000594 TaxID=3154261 RepID=UPI003329AF6C
MRDPFWFCLPPGFIELALDELEQIEARVAADLPAVYPDPLQDLYLRGTGMLLALVGDLHEQGTMHLSFGLHQTEEQSVSTSVLALSDVPTRRLGPNAATAECALQLAVNPLGKALRRELIDLPCGSPAAVVTSILPVPTLSPEVSDALVSVPAQVVQVRVAVGRPAGSRVILVDLTTTASDLWEEYTEIALGVGRSINFSNPQFQPSTPPSASRLWGM